MRGRVSGAGDHVRHSTKRAVLRYVAGCNRIELNTFLNYITQPMHVVVSFDRTAGLEVRLKTVKECFLNADIAPSQLFGWDLFTFILPISVCYLTSMHWLNMLVQ